MWKCEKIWKYITGGSNKALLEQSRVFDQVGQRLMMLSPIQALIKQMVIDEEELEHFQQRNEAKEQRKEKPEGDITLKRKDKY